MREAEEDLRICKGVKTMALTSVVYKGNSKDNWILLGISIFQFVGLGIPFPFLSFERELRTGL